jgi:hypothetical protein
MESRKEYHKQYYKNNKEALNEYAKQYNKDNKEWYPMQSFYIQSRENKILKYLNYKDNQQQLSIL